jgi:hypothetical protein
VVILSDRLVFSAKDVLKGRVDVERLTARYVFLRPGFSYYKTGAKALNYVAKFGWRVVGFSNGWCLLERVDQWQD